MALWAIVSGFMTVESCLLAAVNRTRAQGVLSIVAGALNLGLSIVLAERIGAVGVIAGTILSYLVVLVVPQSLIVRDVLNGLPDQSPEQRHQLPLASCQQQTETHPLIWRDCHAKMFGFQERPCP
jgi:hypothetical protein